jgi:sulfite exporter TauE/SafE
VLGALAGGVVGAVSLGTGWRVVLAGMLALASLLMFAQASTRIAALLPRLTTPRLPSVLEARLGALLAAPNGLRGVALGLLLSALPCGLLYGALAGAAATGSALGGALAMLSFVAGTIPALIGVALLGRFFGKSHGRGMAWARAALFTLNGVVLAGMAVRMLG